MKTPINSIKLLVLFASLTRSSVAHELKIPAALDTVFPVITKAAVFIAERVNLKPLDHSSLAICCGLPNLEARDAFIFTSLNGVYSNTTKTIYPNIQALLIELGHIAATTDPETTAEGQLKKLVTHINYMQSIIELLPVHSPPSTKKFYATFRIVQDRTDPTKLRFIRDYYGSRLSIFGQPVDCFDSLFTKNTLSTKEDVLKKLDDAKNDITTHLQA